MKVAVVGHFSVTVTATKIFSRSRRREFRNPVGSGFHNFSIDLPLILWIIEIFQQRPQIYRTPCKSITIRRSLCIGWCRKPYGIRCIVSTTLRRNHGVVSPSILDARIVIEYVPSSFRETYMLFLFRRFLHRVPISILKFFQDRHVEYLEIKYNPCFEAL